MQMFDEQPHSSNDARSIPAVIPPATASRQVITEPRDGKLIRVVDAHGLALSPVRKVLGGPKMPTSSYPRVATPAQVLSETFELGAEGPAPKCSDAHWSIEVR
jgi:hypothetical protein